MHSRLGISLFIFLIVLISNLQGKDDNNIGAIGIGKRDLYFRTDTVPPSVSPRVFSAVALLEERARQSQDMLSRREILEILAGQSILENAVEFGYIEHICRTAQISHKTHSQYISVLKKKQELKPDIRCNSSVSWTINKHSTPNLHLPPEGSAKGHYLWQYGDRKVIEYVTGENWLGDVLCVLTNEGNSYIVEKPISAITSIYYQPEVKYNLLYPRWHPIRQMQILPDEASLTGGTLNSCEGGMLKDSFVFEKTELVRNVECIVVGNLRWAYFIPRNKPTRIWSKECGFPLNVKINDNALKFWGSTRTTLHLDNYEDVISGFEIPLWSEEKCISIDGRIQYQIETNSVLKSKNTEVGKLNNYEPYYLVDAVNRNSHLVGKVLKRNEEVDAGNIWTILVNLLIVFTIAILVWYRNTSSNAKK